MSDGSYSDLDLAHYLRLLRLIEDPRALELIRTEIGRLLAQHETAADSASDDTD